MTTDAMATLDTRYCRGLPVPYIACWSSETKPRFRLVERRGRLAYADEQPRDRDAHGVPWERCGSSPGRARAEWIRIHPWRQRQVMDAMRCQVCNGPADRNRRGWLWLLYADPDDWAGWPEGMGTTHPPVCARCLPVAARCCPHLCSSAVAVRVADPRPVGVLGEVYQMLGGRPTLAEKRTVLYTEPEIRWTLATQAVRSLHGCTVIGPAEDTR